MSDLDDKVITEAAISNLTELAAYLDIESEVTVNMSLEQVEEELRQMGLDPDLPLPSRIRQLLSTKRGEGKDVDSNAPTEVEGPPEQHSNGVLVSDVNWARKTSSIKPVVITGGSPAAFRWETLHDLWEMEDNQTLLSPSKKSRQHWEQIVLFRDCGENDYAIEVEITLLEGEILNDQLYKEAGVIIRYSGEGRYYYAGLGGFGARTFIGVVEQRDGHGVWSCLASMGKKDRIDFNRVYRLRVECKGNVISLYEDERNRLSVEDDTYRSGSWGLRTVRTQARFADVKEIGRPTYKVAVIMPYSTPYSFIYDVVNDVLVREGCECYRVEELAITQPVRYDLKQRIMNADVIVTDLTNKDTNAYYATGLAHALGKRLILIAESKDNLTFDEGHIKLVIYTNPGELQERLARATRDLFLMTERKVG